MPKLIHVSSRFATLFLAGIFSISAQARIEATDLAEQGIRVGPDVQVSASKPHTSHREVVLDVDSRNRMLACGMTDYLATYLSRKMQNFQCYISQNGGKEWSYSDFDGVSRGDPAVAFGPGNLVYVVGWGPVPGINVHRSTDGGKAFKYLSSIVEDIDRPWIVVDRTGGPSHGWIYVLGDRPFLYVSKDQGKTFVKHKALPGGAELTMLKDGSVATIGKDVISGKDPGELLVKLSLKYVVHSNGGEKMDVRGEIAQLTQNAALNGGGVPKVVVDETDGPFNGRLYATWEDSASGRPEIMFGMSSDEGRSWSKPIRISDYQKALPSDPTIKRAVAQRTMTNVSGVRAYGVVSGANPNAGRAWPALAINRKGVVALTWYEFDDLYDWHLRGAVSVDGGDIFSPSFAVSKPVNALDVGNATLMGVLGTSLQKKVSTGMHSFFQAVTGHTAGLAADSNGVFHALYVDSRTGENQIWTAPIAVSAPVARNGSPALQDYKDISTIVNEHISEAKFDRATGILTVKVAFTNVGKAPLKGPFVMRIRRVRNEVARATIVNADNSVAGRSAIWSFDVPTADGTLMPGATTRARELKLKLEMYNDEPETGTTKAMALEWVVLGRTS